MSEMNLPEEVQETEAVRGAEAAIADPGCACTLYAVVKADGTLERGCGALSSHKLALGHYQVIFNRNVRQCAYVATIGLAGSMGVSPPGEITVVGLFNSPNGVHVTTHDSMGAAADRGFHLAVHCCPTH